MDRESLTRVERGLREVDGELAVARRGDCGRSNQNVNVAVGEQLESGRGVGGVDQLEVNFHGSRDGLTEINVKSDDRAVGLAETEERLRLLDAAEEGAAVLDELHRVFTGLAGHLGRLVLLLLLLLLLRLSGLGLFLLLHHLLLLLVLGLRLLVFLVGCTGADDGASDECGAGKEQRARQPAPLQCWKSHSYGHSFQRLLRAVVRHWGTNRGVYTDESTDMALI